MDGCSGCRWSIDFTKKMMKLKNRRYGKPVYFALLTGFMFLAFFAATWAGIVNMSSDLPPQKWVILFFWYGAFLWVGDAIIKRFILIK